MKTLIVQLRRLLPANRFAREVSVLVGGTAGGQLITFLAAPVLTRFYRPEDFGLLAIFMALMSMAGIIAGLRYQSAIALPDDEKEADALFVLSVFVVLAMTGLAAIPVMLFPDRIAQLLNTPRLADYVFLLPAGIFFIGIYHALNILAIRQKGFAPIAKTKITQALTTLGIQLAGVKFGVVSLLSGQVAGHASGCVSLMLRLLRQRWRGMASVDTAALAEVAWRYKYFPLCGAWTGFLNTAGSQLPSILFAVMFSPAVAGIYALANRVLSVPAQLLGQATSDVFYSRAAQAGREGKLGTLAAAIYSSLTHVAMPPTLVLVIAGPEIFRQVFGPAWEDAGVVAQWLAPWLYVEVLTSPLTSIFAVLDKLGTRLIYEIAALAVRVAAIIAGAFVGDVITAVAFLTAGSIACRVGMLACLVRISGGKWSDIWLPSLTAMLWSVCLVSPLIVDKALNMHSAFWWLALGASAASIAARYVYLMKSA